MILRIKRIIIIIFFSGLIACTPSKSPWKFVDYVNPFVGAAEFGHCMPNACVPFGLIQAGPESGNCSWKYTAGYQFEDSILYGFSQTRLSGTGVTDLGDLLMLPFTGEAVRDKYQSNYQKKDQHASPGYYSVLLDDFNVLAEMTASPHAAIHRYTYKTNSPSHLLIDFQSAMVGDSTHFSQHLLNAEQNFDSPTTITGYANTVAWLERNYYYVIEFSKPYTSKQELALRNDAEKAHRYIFDFNLEKGEVLMVKVALSSVSIEGAKKNLAEEIPSWDFDGVKEAARNDWEKVLSRIAIDGSDEQKRIFYTSMYHLFIHPNNIADSGEPPFYSTLSLWDTYRAAHPLYTLIATDKVDDFVNSMLRQHDEVGHLPIWALWGGETYCMIGNHAVPPIVDAFLKGFRGFDAERAYQAVKSSLTVNHKNSDWNTYDKYGYYPYDIITVESVSRTLESSYDDYCAAQFAKALGKTEDYEFFMKRAGYYKNLFDPDTKLMRPKDSKGLWKTPFNTFVLSHASTSGGDYTEGNAWQYTWHVQHDVNGLIQLMGDPDYFTAKLDTLFLLESKTEGAGFVSDVTGLIGQYAHGNEPSHHVAYLYALAGKPWKTAELINQICLTKYEDKVDGLCGNDDCGQMSAWYIFSSLGFYPVNPCGGEYVLGAPQLPEATLNLPEGKIFRIETENYSKENIYVQSVELNGNSYSRKSISHQDILNGGSLKFYMTRTALK